MKRISNTEISPLSRSATDSKKARKKLGYTDTDYKDRYQIESQIEDRKYLKALLNATINYYLTMLYNGRPYRSISISIRQPLGGNYEEN